MGGRFFDAMKERLLCSLANIQLVKGSVLWVAEAVQSLEVFSSRISSSFLFF
jgi:hypothetical protein